MSAWGHRLRARTLILVTALPALLALGLPAAAHAAGSDTVWTAGLGSDGQLGSGSTASRSLFDQVAGLTDVDQIAGGREHVVARVGGTVWTWGDGSKGATGLGSLTDRSTPTQVAGLSTVTSIAQVSGQSCGHAARTIVRRSEALAIFSSPI